jgi:hypothetical protein
MARTPPPGTLLDPARSRGAVAPPVAVSTLGLALSLAALIGPLQARALDDAAKPAVETEAANRTQASVATQRAASTPPERGQAVPAFDVASIRKWTPGGGASSAPFRHANGAFDRPRNTVASLVEFAFDVQSYQVIGGPDWVRRDLFAVHARTAETASLAQIRLMVQSLLAERFGLRVSPRPASDADLFAVARAVGRASRIRPSTGSGSNLCAT